MKSRKDYKKVSIGSSDIASLTCRSGMEAYVLHFGIDADYEAYIVDDECEIPDFYEKEFECSYWLKIYDDYGLTFSIDGKKIIVYRAKDCGCIIQVIN